MRLTILLVPIVARVYSVVPQITSRNPTELVYPGRIAASVNAYVPNTTNPVSAPFFTSPWIRNHASVMHKYAMNAYNGELSVIPRASYLDFMNVEMKGTSSIKRRAPKIIIGGTFMYCTLRFSFLILRSRRRGTHD